MSKIIKKITRPVSKVLDKIVPNELKPALPYLAAFAPYMLGPGFGAGFGSGIFSNPATQKMIARGLFSGGANALSQLSQEGNEGDLNAMSLALSAGQGALTAPGASETLMGARSGELGSQMIQQSPMGPMVSSPSAYIDTSNIGMLGKAKNLGLKGLAKSADFLEKSSEALRSPGFNKETLMAATAPISQGTGEVMMYEANAAMREYERVLADYNAEQGALGLASDEGRRNAILAAMRAYNHPEDLIESTLAELGLRNGGIISLQNGGRVNFRGGGMDYMPTEPRMMGNPAVVEVIEAGDDMRENRKMNPNIEDIADYSIQFQEGNEEPDFGGIEEAVEKRPADSTLMRIAQEIGPMLLGVPGMVYKAGSEAYKLYKILKPEDQDKVMDISEKISVTTQNKAMGGIMNNYNMGGSVLPAGMEMDYRGGGFIPMGSKERADDVPARVSKNEFVMTADAVKAAGGGSVNEGARKMYDLMNNLEARA